MPLKFYSRIWLCAVFDKFLGFLQYSKCENFDASIPYLAMSYFNHYIVGVFEEGREELEAYK